MPIEKKEWQEAEGMWEVTKEDAEKGDVSGVYLWSLLSKYYPENKDKQIRLMGFIAEASRKYREGLPREKAWELAKKWDVERMLTTELMEFLPQNNPSNPMKTEAQRKSLHERIFGKGSTPPLERLGKGETLNNLLPMAPTDGPPLPRMLALRWPWKK